MVRDCSRRALTRRSRGAVEEEMLPLNAHRDRNFGLRRRWRAARRPLLAVALAAFALVAVHSAAQAQIVALVNGDPITALDVARRTKLIQLSTQKTPTRQ